MEQSATKHKRNSRQQPPGLPSSWQIKCLCPTRARRGASPSHSQHWREPGLNSNLEDQARGLADSGWVLGHCRMSAGGWTAPSRSYTLTLHQTGSTGSSGSPKGIWVALPLYGVPSQTRAIASDCTRLWANESQERQPILAQAPPRRLPFARQPNLPPLQNHQRTNSKC